MVDLIKRLCKERKMTLSGLERACGIGTHVIYKWDKNIPSSDKLKRVADYLGVTMEYLINDGVETKSNDDACAESIQSNDAYAESIRSNPDLMLLLSAASELKREDIALVVQLIERIKRQ